MWRKHAFLPLLGISLLFVGSSQATMVEFDFQVSAHEFMRTSTSAGSMEWEGDPFDAMIQVLMDVDTWEEGTTPDDLDYVSIKGTFASARATSGDDVLAFAAEDLMLYPHPFNQASASYAHSDTEYAMFGYINAGSSEQYQTDTSGVRQGVEAWIQWSTPFWELVPFDGPPPYAEGMLYDWQLYSFGATEEGGPCIVSSLHGIRFAGSFTCGHIVPEPATVTLFGIGMAGLILRRLKRIRA